MADINVVTSAQGMNLGPLNVFFCWESVALAAGVHVCTRAIKSALFLVFKEPRQQLWVKHVVMPVVPLLLGACAAVIFPLHPAWLTDYMEQEEITQSYALFFCYGGMIGVFADYIHQRISSAFKLREGIRPPEDDDKTPPDRPALVP